MSAQNEAGKGFFLWVGGSVFFFCGERFSLVVGGSVCYLGVLEIHVCVRVWRGGGNRRALCAYACACVCLSMTLN